MEKQIVKCNTNDAESYRVEREKFEKQVAEEAKITAKKYLKEEQERKESHDS